MGRATIRRLRELHETWWMAEQLARKAQGEVRIVIEEFVEGGLRPTRQQLDRMDEFRHLADRNRQDLDEMLFTLMQ